MSKPVETTTMAKVDPKVQEQVSTLRGMFERSKDQWAMVLPKHMDVDRMMRIALTVCQRTPKLLDCHPQSILACLMLSAEVGLELSGPLGQCFMIPRWNKHTKRQEATFQIGYRGFHRLAFNSGKVSTMPMHAIYANDDYNIEMGTNGRIYHKPCLGPHRGDPVGYYCIANFIPAGQDFEFMSHPETVEHRRRYASDNGIWDGNWEQMALKTVVRRLCKRLPVSAVAQAAAIDEYAEIGIEPLTTGERIATATAARMERLKQKIGGDQAGDDMLPAITEEPPQETIPMETAKQPVPVETKQATAETKQANEEPPVKDQAVTEATKKEVAKLQKQAGIAGGDMGTMLMEYGVSSIDALQEFQAQELIGWLRNIIEKEKQPR